MGLLTSTPLPHRGGTGQMAGSDRSEQNPAGMQRRETAQHLQAPGRYRQQEARTEKPKGEKYHP